MQSDSTVKSQCLCSEAFEGEQTQTTLSPGKLTTGQEKGHVLTIPPWLLVWSLAILRIGSRLKIEMCQKTGLVKWPFLAANAFFLVTAFLIFRHSTVPMRFGQMTLAVLCVAAGACLSLIPFFVEYRANKFAEPRGAAPNVEATPKPQDRSADGSPESLYLKVLIQMLDHVYALYIGALRSGKPHLVDQLGNFQDACRAAAGRIALIPFSAEPGEPFNAQRHELDGDGLVSAQSRVAETIATGYTFKGRLLRPALVRLLERDEDVRGEQWSPADLELKAQA